MKPYENTLNEIEQERTSYLLNLDDMNYELLAEPLIIGNNSAMTQNSYIGIMGEINLVNLYTDEYTGNNEFTKILDIQSQIEFPKRKFQQVRPATLEDELSENSPYSK